MVTNDKVCKPCPSQNHPLGVDGRPRSSYTALSDSALERQPSARTVTVGPFDPSWVTQVASHHLVPPDWSRQLERAPRRARGTSPLSPSPSLLASRPIVSDVWPPIVTPTRSSTSQGARTTAGALPIRPDIIVPPELCCVPGQPPAAVDLARLGPLSQPIPPAAFTASNTLAGCR